MISILRDTTPLTFLNLSSISHLHHIRVHSAVRTVPQPLLNLSRRRRNPSPRLLLCILMWFLSMHTGYNRGLDLCLGASGVAIEEVLHHHRLPSLLISLLGRILHAIGSLRGGNGNGRLLRSLILQHGIVGEADALMLVLLRRPFIAVLDSRGGVRARCRLSARGRSGKDLLDGC
jgi:hypothetical protein